MAGFLRSKQTGMQKDLSASIASTDFNPDDLARYGINSQISCLAYDPVQSLLATLEPAKPTSFRSLHFTGNKLVSLDSRNDLTIWDLDSAKRTGGGMVPGGAVCITTDPMLDWAMLALTSGEILAFDLDRERVAKGFRLPNFWKEKDPHARQVQIVDVSFHPKDIGKLLISYTHGAVIYSIKQAQAQHFFEYKLPPALPAERRSRLVFWDTKEGKLLMARTLMDMRVDQPSRHQVAPRMVTPFTKISWCCKENADDTGLLIAGGQAPEDPSQGLTFIELGPTPIYATSSWQILSEHFAGKRQICLPLPPGVQVDDYQLIPAPRPILVEHMILSPSSRS
ncbi:unnamed protein product [Parascedosporium putredinis]|uniref:Uncharacterized protein n=1 Tax=Parascedosporium putredinis TaxID=1442378 RepID=A0A9P1MFQ8_9PEZI|nr:unnamed protein product [Parascedosporium putredinis]CAI8003996.1 unnamed protein product [Parascedosporium putredinis]